MKSAIKWTMAAASAFVILFGAASFARTGGAVGGHGAQGVHGAHESLAAGHNSAGLRGYRSTNGSVASPRAFNEIVAAPHREFSSRHAGDRREGYRNRFDGRRRFLVRGRGYIGGNGPSDASWMRDDASCGGPAIYEIGSPLKHKGAARMPRLIYGIAPPCAGGSSAGAGPGIYSFN